MPDVHQANLLLENDWRTLVILDACRWDVFNELKKADEVVSYANQTMDWYRDLGNFVHVKDVILVTDSPVPFTHKWGSFYTKFHAAHYTEDPSETLELAEKIRLTTQRQMIIHVMPPHLPFIGEGGKKFLKRIMPHYDRELATERVANWGRKNGFKQLRDFYKESLMIMLSAVLMQPWLKGAVITSDHGELIGEGGMYGHGRRPAAERNCWMVPWCRI